MPSASWSRPTSTCCTDGSTAPTEELLDGAHHNQPLDVQLDSRGRIWFADAYNAQPPYGLPAYPMLDHASVLRLDPTGPRDVPHRTHHPRHLRPARGAAVEG